MRIPLKGAGDRDMANKTTKTENFEDKKALTLCSLQERSKAVLKKEATDEVFGDQ